MKTKYYLLFAIIIFFVSFCSKQTSIVYAQQQITLSDSDKYITRFDTDLMAKKHLTNYTLVRKRGKWNYGREYVFRLNNDEANIFLTVGLHPSTEVAENIAKSFLNGISIRMTEGTHNGISIGDKFWWFSGSDPSTITDIVFIRNNSLIIMSCSRNYSDLRELAKLIDDDIIMGALYVKIDDAIFTPEVNSISMGKNTIELNDTVKIAIDANDPNHESLEYQFSPGLSKVIGDAENVYTYKDSPNYVKESDGSQTIRLVVINESNVVSIISEINVRYNE